LGRCVFHRALILFAPTVYSDSDCTRTAREAQDMGHTVFAVSVLLLPG
jgi:hypothetical protein